MSYKKRMNSKTISNLNTKLCDLQDFKNGIFQLWLLNRLTRNFNTFNTENIYWLHKLLISQIKPRINIKAPIEHQAVVSKITLFTKQAYIENKIISPSGGNHCYPKIISFAIACFRSQLKAACQS